MSKIRNMEAFAAVSGVSRPTLSKYFRDPGSVRASTRARIEAALAQHDYQPNHFAINQNRKQTTNLGIVVPYLSDPFFAEIARRIEQRCIAANFRPILLSSHGDPAHERGILDQLRAMKPAGVLLAPLGRISDQRAIEAFCQTTPTVVFDGRLERSSRPFVGSDNPQFLQLIVEYLSRTGSPPCFFEMATPANPNAKRRREGYVAAMRRLDLEPQIVQAPGRGWAFEEIGLKAGLAALEQGRFAGATVLCSNDRLAIGLLAACHQQGVKVGRGDDCALRVAGMDDHPFARFTCPSLTTVAQNYEAISRSSVETLFRAMRGEAVEGEVALFDGALVMRDSA